MPEENPVIIESQLQQYGANSDADLWWKQARIYELYVDKFAGNFKNLTARLEYFNKLGINTLHILPHYPSPMVDQGYDVSDYYNVRPELGTLDDFKTFVAAAHDAGIRIITDMVLNHVSEQHPWFKEASASKHNTKRDFFLWSDTGKEFSLAVNMFPDIKPSNWIPHPSTGDFYYATFYPGQPDLNYDNPEVMQEMLKVMDFWVDMGVDGFRLDAVCFFKKREGTDCRGIPETHHMVKMLRTHLDMKYPRGIALLGESGEDMDSIKKYFGDGDECHLMYHFPLMAEMWRALKEGDSSLIEPVVADSFDIPQSCQWAAFLRNHDEIELRFLGEDSIHNMVKWLDPTGDYLMNQGEGTAKRVASVLDGDEEKTLEAFRMLYGVPFAPIMYYGDEIGMENLAVEPGIIDTRLYVRGVFDWSRAQRLMQDPESLLNKTADIIHAATNLREMQRTPELLVDSESEE